MDDVRVACDTLVAFAHELGAALSPYAEAVATPLLQLLRPGQHDNILLIRQTVLISLCRFLCGWTVSCTVLICGFPFVVFLCGWTVSCQFSVYLMLLFLFVSPFFRVVGRVLLWVECLFELKKKFNHLAVHCCRSCGY